jgi:hypothetical protein
MNGNYKIADIKLMHPDLFDWEHSSRNTDETVMGLRIDDDGTFKLECWLGLTPKGYTRDSKICTESDGGYKDVAIALEYSNGEWFWMHISDYREPRSGEDIKIPLSGTTFMREKRELKQPIRGLSNG